MQRIGQVLKSNGKEGELLISFPGFAPEDIDLQEPVFIYFDGLPVPFYFESFIPRGNNRALVHLTGIRCLEDADEVAGQSLFADYFEEYEEGDLTGWAVQDAAGKPVGEVIDYEDIPGNTCLWLRLPGGEEKMVPFHQDLVLGIDEKARVISLHIPEGLL